MRNRIVTGNESLEKIFSDLFQNIYGKGNTFTQVSPRLQNASTTEELLIALGEQLTQREIYISRLEKIIVLLKKESKKSERGKSSR